LIGEYVVGSRNPLFSSMQPSIRVKDSPEWVHAWCLVLSYLRTFAPDTVRSIEMELQRCHCKSPAQDSDSLPFSIPDLLRATPAAFAVRAAAFRGVGHPITIRRGRRSHSEVIDFNAESETPLPSEDDRPAVDELSSGRLASPESSVNFEEEFEYEE
jgi:hypothetical protein